MSTYLITLPDGGKNRILADSDAFVEGLFPGKWTREDEPLPAPQAPATRWITRLAFRLRFTKGERVALKIASLDNPAADMAARVQAASVSVDLEDTQSATYIDLDREDTRAGVRMMEAAGLIGPGRAAEILDAPAQPAEVYQP